MGETRPGVVLVVEPIDGTPIDDSSSLTRLRAFQRLTTETTCHDRGDRRNQGRRPGRPGRQIEHRPRLADSQLPPARPAPVPAAASSQPGHAGRGGELALIDGPFSACVSAPGDPQKVLGPGPARARRDDAQHHRSWSPGAPDRVERCVGHRASRLRRVLPVTDPLRVDLAFSRCHLGPIGGRRYDQCATPVWWTHRLWGSSDAHLRHPCVSVETGSQVLPILKALLTRTAHLQCPERITSPFWAGCGHTGYADNRAMMLPATAHLPAPPGCTWEQLESFPPGTIFQRHRGLHRDPLGTCVPRHIGHHQYGRATPPRTSGRNRGADPSASWVLSPHTPRTGAGSRRVPDWYVAEQMALGPPRHGRDPHRQLSRAAGGWWSFDLQWWARMLTELT